MGKCHCGVEAWGGLKMSFEVGGWLGGLLLKECSWFAPSLVIGQSQETDTSDESWPVVLKKKTVCSITKSSFSRAIFGPSDLWKAFLA